MTRFYFHIQDHDERHVDPEGGDFDHAAAAESALLITLRALLQEGRISLDQVAHWTVHVTDDHGVTHVVLPVREVLTREQ